MQLIYNFLCLISTRWSYHILTLIASPRNTVIHRIPLNPALSRLISNQRIPFYLMLAPLHIKYSAVWNCSVLSESTVTVSLTQFRAYWRMTPRLQVSRITSTCWRTSALAQSHYVFDVCACLLVCVFLRVFLYVCVLSMHDARVCACAFERVWQLLPILCLMLKKHYLTLMLLWKECPCMTLWY